MKDAVEIVKSVIWFGQVCKLSLEKSANWDIQKRELIKKRHLVLEALCTIRKNMNCLET